MKEVQSEITKALQKREMIPSEIVLETGLTGKQVTNALTLLKKKGVVTVSGQRAEKNIYVLNTIGFAEKKKSSKRKYTPRKKKEKNNSMTDEEFRLALRTIIVEAERRLLQLESLKRKLRTLGGEA